MDVYISQCRTALVTRDYESLNTFRSRDEFAYNLLFRDQNDIFSKRSQRGKSQMIFNTIYEISIIIIRRFIYVYFLIFISPQIENVF